MFQDAFVRLEQQEVEAILGEVNPLVEGSAFDAALTTILAQELSFYPGYRFLEIADYETVPNNKRFAIYKEGSVTILDWTNEPLYQLNNKVPIKLTAETIVAYVQFFFSYVKGRHGRFIIIDGADDIEWRETPPPAAIKAMGKLIAPIQLKDFDDEIFTLTAHMLFKNSLFKTDIEAQVNGLVSLTNEELLVEDIPVQDDRFGQ